MRLVLLTLVGGLALLSPAAVAQRPDGAKFAMPAPDISSDSVHGNMLRVYYSKVDDPVTIETTPEVHFVCSSNGTTECYAYLKPTATVKIQVWRKPARLRLGANPKGIPAQGNQWRESCVGSGDSCTVTMTSGRSAGVNWLAQP